jgi:hypothetical protein
MKVEARDYDLFYNVLLRKYILDFYNDDISGLNWKGADIWRQKFKNVKRLKSTKIATNKINAHDYGEELIPRVIFGLTDTNGKYFYTKWKEAKKQPHDFSITTEFLFKALRYLQVDGLFEMEHITHHKLPDKIELNNQTQKLWNEFLKKHGNLNAKASDFDQREKEVLKEAEESIHLFFALINERKIIDAWMKLSPHFQSHGNWFDFEDFKNDFNSEYRSRSFSNIHILNAKLQTHSIGCLIYVKERLRYAPPQGINELDELYKNMREFEYNKPEEKEHMIDLFKKMYEGKSRKQLANILAKELYYKGAEVHWIYTIEFIRIENRLFLNRFDSPEYINHEFKTYSID